ncbi:unnamed protein product [Camellia sinensis]
MDPNACNNSTNNFNSSSFPSSSSNSTIIFFIKHITTNRQTPRPPPGPPGLPFIGNLHQIILNSSAPHSYLYQLAQEHGPLMSLRLGSVPTLVKHVMKTHDLAFSGRPILLRQQKLSYNGLDVAFSPYNDLWREMRKIIVSRMVKKISQLVDSSKVVNLSEVVMSLTITLICRVAFGKRYEESEGFERSRFNGLLNEVQAMMGSFFKNFKELDLFYQDFIDDHLNPKRTEFMQEDMLDILLQLKMISSLQLISLWITLKQSSCIFAGGTDTGVAAVVWERNIYMVAEDDVLKLPYLKSVIREAMRLYPPIPLSPRQAIDKCIIDGYEIQPKTLVYINSWAIGRDPEAWEDPEEFLPEKILDCDIDFRGQDFQLIPFRAGRRGCPGINLGIAPVELALANLLYSFGWELPDGMKKEDTDDTNVMPGVAMHRH